MALSDLCRCGTGAVGGDLDCRSPALLTGGRGAGDLERDRLNRLSKVTERVGERMALRCCGASPDVAGEAGEARLGLGAAEDGVDEAEAEVEPLLWRGDRSGRWDGILEHYDNQPHKARQKSRRGAFRPNIMSVLAGSTERTHRPGLLEKQPSLSTVASGEHHWRLASRGSGGNWQSLGAGAAAGPRDVGERGHCERACVARFYEV